MFAIQLKNVSKIYNLYGSQKDQFIDLLGLQRFGIKPKTKPKKFVALNDISLEIKRGQRIGIIGRNGAGKTTLLKLLCGSFIPTQGSVKVNGEVQALMSVGLGFHPEYTGRENAETSLMYNGLPYDEYQKAMEGIIDFCELGDFLDQPFKTYSLGMQARLMFAAATAVKPNILIVDEVLGAGDAYFVAKSKSRINKLVDSGCTMLLVSHSMQQVLELCDVTIWMDQGQILMRGESFLVVKAYEKYLFGSSTDLRTEVIPVDTLAKLEPDSEQEKPPSKSNLYLNAAEFTIKTRKDYQQQEPLFVPHLLRQTFPDASEIGFNFQAPGGISRWDNQLGLKVIGFSVLTHQGLSNILVSLQPAKFVIYLKAEVGQKFNCCYGIAIHDHLGVCVARLFSPQDCFEAVAGDLRSVNVILNPCQIGPGEYTVGISVTEYSGIEKLNSAKRYDLLSRSFQIKVEVPDSIAAASAAFFHSSEWIFNLGQK